MPEHAASRRSHGMRTGVIAGAIAALGLVVIAVAGAVHLLAASWETPLAGPNAPMDSRIAGPQLESAPQYERARYFAEKNALLDQYAWIDRGNGIARIPIAVAMRLLAAPASGADPDEGRPSEGAGR